MSVFAVLPLFALLGSVAKAAPTATANAAANPECTCGYVLSQYQNAYYPLAHLIDFTAAPDEQLDSADALSPYGFRITHEGGVGGSRNGVQAIGSYHNLRIRDGALELLVPGGQDSSTGLTAAEISFEGQYNGMTGGLFTVETQIDSIPGTCQAIFTYHDASNSGTTQDEQNIEILGSYLFESGDNGTPPGIELSNFDPIDPNNARSDTKIVPFPSDPTIAYHNYTIHWKSDVRDTYFDDILLDSPAKYVSVNPSDLVINHWSNGDPGFTQGPPITDVLMRVRRAQFYFKTSAVPGLPDGCTTAKACTV